MSPRVSASRMIWRAARSLTDSPGFMNSALPRIAQPVASDARLSAISGVLPMASMTPFLTSIGSLQQLDSFLHDWHRRAVDFRNQPLDVCPRNRPDIQTSFSGLGRELPVGHRIHEPLAERIDTFLRHARRCSKRPGHYLTGENDLEDRALL